MAITDAQRAKLEAIAKARGLDIETLVAQAEDIIAKRVAVPKGPPKMPTPESPAGATSNEQPKLFQYHMPFVTVDEVRTKWLGLDAWGADKGGDEVAATFALKAAPPTQPVPAEPSKSPTVTMLPGTGTAGK